MSTLFISVAAALALVFLALVATIVIRRMLADRRCEREHRLRPGIEDLLGDFISAASPQRPSLPADRASRELVRMVALEEMAELQGRERERLRELLEQSGLVAETALGLGSRRVRVRRAAAEELRQVGSEAAAGSLNAGLADRDADAALTCAAALAELPEERFVRPVLDLAAEKAVERPGAVAAILVTLGHRHPAAIGTALTPAMPIELRRLAAAVASELRLAEHVPLLREGLAAADDELAARAGRGLGRIGDDGALEALIATVEDGERAWYVRLAATEALGAIGDPRAVVPLERELNDEGWMLQAKAARALNQLGAAGQDVLRRALASPAEAVREHARVALER